MVDSLRGGLTSAEGCTDICVRGVRGGLPWIVACCSSPCSVCLLPVLPRLLPRLHDIARPRHQRNLPFQPHRLSPSRSWHPSRDLWYRTIGSMDSTTEDTERIMGTWVTSLLLRISLRPLRPLRLCGSSDFVPAARNCALPGDHAYCTREKENRCEEGKGRRCVRSIVRVEK